MARHLVVAYADTVSALIAFVGLGLRGLAVEIKLEVGKVKSRLPARFGERSADQSGERAR